VFINTPGNPAGNIISAADLDELSGFCLERNIWLVCDEVYSMITFEDTHVSLRRAAASLENVIVVHLPLATHKLSGRDLVTKVARSEPITIILYKAPRVN